MTAQKEATELIRASLSSSDTVPDTPNVFVVMGASVSDYLYTLMFRTSLHVDLDHTMDYVTHEPLQMLLELGLGVLILCWANLEQPLH